MLTCLFGYDETVAQFVASLIPHCRRGFGAARAMGVIDGEGRLIGGMVYHNWDAEAEIMEMSGAAVDPRWLTRRTLAAMYQYPFLVCGCQMVVMRVPADNERLLRQLAVFGYTFFRMPRLFGRHRDGVVCSLTAENWSSNKFNKKQTSAPEFREAAE